MEIHQICICGAGTMGMGIAQVCAAAGYPVVVYEPNEAPLLRAQQQLPATLRQLVEKGKLDAGQAAAIREKITYVNKLQHAKADLVIEAVVEDFEVKADLFRQLEDLLPPHALFCSNTSSFSISRLAERLQHPGRLAGLHFFNPATLMKLVEVVRGEKTAEAVAERLVSFTRSLGKTAVVCRDAPGFIVNRVARPFYIESLRLLESGACSAAQADRLLESLGFRLGPFRLMDLIGNDVNYAVSCSVYEQLGRPERLRPSPLQQQQVAAGALGRKTGKGYYEY